jgi:hypothetical protein
MELQAGQKRKFILEIQPPEAQADVRWESENPSIASVQDGEVWGQKPGQTRIRAVSVQDPSKQGIADVIVAGSAPEPEPYKNAEKNTEPVPKPKPIPKPEPTPKPEPENNENADKFVAEADDKPVEKPNKAILTVTSAPPFAEVIVDGRFMGTTPVKDKELSTGRHKLQITHRSFPPIDTVINLGPGEKSLRFRLFR